MRQHDNSSDKEYLNGKYKIESLIGSGGMSEVYLARDTHLDKKWAIKKIRKNIAGDKQQIVMNSLITEANIMKRLDHPALPRIVDIIDEDGLIFVVMDYIPGKSLSSILNDEGPVDEDRIIDWGIQLASALAYLHSQDPPIIYRDMKPSNVMLKPDGKLAIIDFGIAREYKQERSNDTAVLGTLGYAPPEQHGSRQTDIRSDIYALGMTLHHLVTGADPRKSDYIYQSARNYNEELSVNIEQILDKCTALDPDDRYQSCDELIFDLNNPEMISARVKKKLKIKLLLWLITLFLTISSGMGSVTAYSMYRHNNNENYIRLTSASGNTDEKIEAYLEAVELYPYRPEAYELMLDEYRQSGVFGDKQSAEFTRLYNRYSDGFNLNDTDSLNLIYKAGVTYFFYYSGNDESFRSRILSSRKYFQTVVDNANDEYENLEMARAYVMLGDFYADYVLSDKKHSDAGIVSEPSADDYTRLLSAIGNCLDSVDEYSGDDIAFIRMTFYREILNLINDYRQGLAMNRIDEKEVLKVIERIQKNTSDMFVTQTGTVELKDQIAKLCDQYRINVDTSYRSIR